MVRRRRVEKELGVASHATDKYDLEIALLSTPEEWFYLRVELHSAMKGRIRIGDAAKLSLRRLVQLHAILDKVDSETEAKLQEMKKSQLSRRR